MTFIQIGDGSNCPLILFIKKVRLDSLKHFDSWLPQDWSNGTGVRFWLYGRDTGATFFFDIIDDRIPDSTTDTAERFTYTFSDDFSGWREIEIPFANFVRKDIGNSAPNNGLNLNEVNGWAFGILGDGVREFYYLDDIDFYPKTVRS